MTRSEKREQEERWLARKAIRRALYDLTRAEGADDDSNYLRLAISFAASAANECRKAEAHFQRAIREQKTREGEQ